MRYTVIIERGEDGGWGGYAPDLPGLVLAGDTKEQLMATMLDGVETYLDALREGGLPIPSPRTEATVVEVPVEAA